LQNRQGPRAERDRPIHREAVAKAFDPGIKRKTRDVRIWRFFWLQNHQASGLWIFLSAHAINANHVAVTFALLNPLDLFVAPASFSSHRFNLFQAILIDLTILANEFSTTETAASHHCFNPSPTGFIPS
jgi:hypothetical protein